MNVFIISPLMHGMMLQVPLPTTIFNNSYLAPKHINFARSLPYSNIKVIFLNKSLF